MILFLIDVFVYFNWFKCLEFFFLLNVKYVIINLICICFMYYVIFFNNFYVDKEIRLMYCELFLLIIMKKINCEILFVFF